MKNILIGISGGIAAYKIYPLARLFIKQGYQVKCVLTDHALQFINPLTLEALTGEPVRQDLFDENAERAMSHIELARWADIFLIAPATANTIAKLANGIADNLLNTIYLATDAEVMIAPAMNHLMWQHESTQHNLNILSQRRNHQILPVGKGEQACGETGAGRLLEPEDILQQIEQSNLQDLRGLSILITAGPTQEKIDPVRFLSNHSSGKMGYALTEAACRRGAQVTLVSGPTALAAPNGCHLIRVTSAIEMYKQVMALAQQQDIVIGAAAVSDYRIAQPLDEKHKKTINGNLHIELIENPDIIKGVAALQDNRPFTVGFAAETEHTEDYAQKKRIEKNLDLIIANNVSQNVFGNDDNSITIIDQNQQKFYAKTSKKALAQIILNTIKNKVNHHEG